MRTGLTPQQTAILNADVKKVSWLFEIDRDNNGTVDYRWSTQARTWATQPYVAKIMSFTPLVLAGSSPELGIIPPTSITIQASFKDHHIDGIYASGFEGASITVRLIGSTTADGEAELMAWRFRVMSAMSLDQILTLECQDWFTLQLEGDYPNTPLISDLFPADIMKQDNACVPLVFGFPFFPIRWITHATGAYYMDVDTFVVDGNQIALFSAGQFLLAQCGTDGLKSCWVDSSSYGFGVTTVNLTSASGSLTANLTTVSTDHYLLGPTGKTYTINRARTPQQVNFKTTYLATGYSFKQDTIPGSDGENYRVMQLLCDDANKDGVNDANGFWGIIGKEIYDLPCCFWRSDLGAKVNPADIANWVFQDWGIPAVEIDDVSRAAAADIFYARNLYLNIGLWYRMPREKFISKLFTISGMMPLYRDKIGFKVLTKVSQMTITESLVEPGSFRIGRTFTQKQKDSGYVTWQAINEPVDTVNKSLIAAKSSTDKPSDTTIEAEWLLDSVKAQKAGKLALQRILLRDKTITFTANSKILVLEPGDMITISPQNFGAEGAAYTCQISRMSIREGLWVDVECIRFSAPLDDWDDLSADALVIGEANSGHGCSPVYQGPTDAAGTAGSNANVITQTVQIGAGGILATNEAPETNGGFKATNTELTCYNTSGAIRFQAKYAGTDQGDVIIGDYAGGQGIKWDQSDAKLNIKVTETGGIEVSGGGDITLSGSDTDPGRIKFAGTSYAVEIGGDADGNRFLIKANTVDIVTLYLGYNNPWFGDDGRFKYIYLEAMQEIGIISGSTIAAEHMAQIYLNSDPSETEPYIQFTFWDKNLAASSFYKIFPSYFGPGSHKSQDLGRASYAWNDAYADDFQNVADFFFLDRRLVEEGKIIPVDDLEVIRTIGPGGVFDPRTGLELIDDNTLPEWLLSRDKVSGKILRDPAGKPYLSLKAMISLCLGAIRQLDRKKW